MVLVLGDFVIVGSRGSSSAGLVVWVKGSSLKWKSYLTGGLVNNSIEEDMAGFIKKMRTNGVNMEGLIYSGGKSAIIFKYK